MVQITFAFVIILGYLLSHGMEETQNLEVDKQDLKDRVEEQAAEMQRQKELAQEQAAEAQKQKELAQEQATEAQRQKELAQEQAAEAQKQKELADNRKTLNTQLHGIVSELKNTEVGEAIAARVAAEKKSQLANLLSIWADQRDGRLLFLLITQFRGAAFIPLSDDMDCLPVEESFQDLGAEAAGVFLVGDQKVSASVVAQLRKSVIEAGGFDLNAGPGIIESEETPFDAKSLYIDPDFPTPDNLRMLKLRIISDLEEERQWLADLQYALVGKIASKRRDKLANLALADEEELGAEKTDLGISMLEDILAGLEERIQLLPEVSDRIRGELTELQPVKSPK